MSVISEVQLKYILKNSQISKEGEGEAGGGGGEEEGGGGEE